MVGGGCYGTFYASQLAKAKARGKTDHRTVIVVDRNPDCQAKRELGEARDREFVVSDWTTFFDEFDRPGADETRYVSWADWICPTHCIEPALCPAIGAPRTWEMGDSVRELADQLRAGGRAVTGPALFVCKHQVFGVGMFSAEAVRDGDRLVAEGGASGSPAEVLVGTISSCHGALNLLSIGRQPSAVSRVPSTDG